MLFGMNPLTKLSEMCLAYFNCQENKKTWYRIGLSTANLRLYRASGRNERMSQNRLKTNASFKRTRANFDSTMGRWILTIILVGLCGGVVFLIYDEKYHAAGPSTLEVYFLKIKNWMTLRSAHLHPIQNNQKPIAQVVGNKSADEPSIHFEFYDALPNMQVTVSERTGTKETHNNPEQNTKSNSLDIKKKRVVAAKTINKNNQETEKENTISIPGSSTFIKADELERDLSLQLKQQYIIQLGVFKNIEAAEHYRKSLIGAGFAVKITKLGLRGKIFYRVEQGPFLKKEKVNMAQLKLQQKGFRGLILNNR